MGFSQSRGPKKPAPTFFSKKGFSLAAVRRLSGAEVLMRNKEATDLFDEVTITVACDTENAAIQGQARAE